MTEASEKRPKPETAEEAKARHRWEDEHDLVHNSTRPRRAGPPYEGGRAWCDLARMALARKASDRTEEDWDAIGRHPDPPSGVTGLPGWESRRGSDTR